MRWIVRFVDNHFTTTSLLVTGLFELLLVIWGENYKGHAVLLDFLKGNRSAVYGALASVSGSLFGFVITAVSIVLGFSTSDKMTIVRNSKHYPALWSAFTHAIRMLGLATATAMFCLIFDRDTNPFKSAIYIEAFVIVLTVFLLCRSIWALEQVIKTVSSPSKTTKTP